MKKGKLFVISGPSGVGKDTIVNEYLKENDAHLSVSATTRNPREGEIHGIHYYFYTNEEFEDRIKVRNLDSEEMIQNRLKIAEEEIKEAGFYDYVLVNKDVKGAVNKLKMIIDEENEKD